MFIKESDNFHCHVRKALLLPLSSRCAELTVLFDRGSLLELQSLYPVLIDHIFGPQGSVGWGLRNIPESGSEEYKQLQHFFSPLGPLFKLIYTLLKDPCTKYDFPLAYLPIKIRQILQNSSHIYPFYVDLININPQNKQIVSLLLNPFDYFMFHFAYHLINPWHQRGSVITPNASWNTVYYSLCCEYMFHFLPTTPGAAVLPLVFYNGKNPFQSMPELRRQPCPSRLINPGFINNTIDDFKIHQNFEKHPRNEIWRSETVLTVFIDMWFNNDQINQPSTQMNNSFNATQMSNLLLYNELPTGEYMRIIRVLIKQIHAFFISSKADDSHMGELKKIGLPMLQAKFYTFLRNLIHRWPLDGSFRLVLEVWLSYIQPWRYPPENLVRTRNKGRSINPDAEDAIIGPMKSVDREFLPFIAENLLVFVVIFQQLLPRFSRVDLVSPKMAVMLYRITKVFSQPNLPTYLREIEQCVENNHSPSHTYNSHWTNSLPPLSPTSNWSTNILVHNSAYHMAHNKSHTADLSSTFHTSPCGLVDKKWSAIVRQKIYEMEGSNFYYKPLFSVPVASEVYDLIYLIKRSIRTARELLEMKKAEDAERHSGIFGFFRSLFESSSTNDEFTLSERLKVPTYLECSLQNLMEIFQIAEIDEREPDTSISNASGSGLELSDDMSFLTPQRVRERIKKIKYDGDPDLLPIQSNEVTFLVRAIYQACCRINEDFGNIFNYYYHQDSYMGRIFRQVLQPPLIIHRFDKTKPGSPRVSKSLPPRVSLRYFASYQFVIYFILGALFFRFALGYGLASYVFLLILLYVVYVCLKAIPRSSTRLDYPTDGFGNISFNDSF